MLYDCNLPRWPLKSKCIQEELIVSYSHFMTSRPFYVRFFLHLIHPFTHNALSLPYHCKLCLFLPGKTATIPWLLSQKDRGYTLSEFLKLSSTRGTDIILALIRSCCCNHGRNLRWGHQSLDRGNFLETGKRCMRFMQETWTLRSHDTPLKCNHLIKTRVCVDR